MSRASHPRRTPPPEPTEPRGPGGGEGTRRDVREAPRISPTRPGRACFLPVRGGAPVQPPERSARAPRAAASSSPSCFGSARIGTATGEAAASPGGDPHRAPAGPRRLRSASATAARARRGPGGCGGRESRGVLLGSGAESFGRCDHGVCVTLAAARPAELLARQTRSSSSARRVGPAPSLSLNHVRARIGPWVSDPRSSPSYWSAWSPAPSRL